MRYELDHPADYYYLPEEDMVIPKVLASSIDSSRLKKATRQNCCVKKEGLFFPIDDFVMKPEGLPVFREHPQSRQTYLEFPETKSEEFIQRHLESILHSIESYK